MSIETALTIGLTLAIFSALSILWLIAKFAARSLARVVPVAGRRPAAASGTARTARRAGATSMTASRRRTDAWVAASTRALRIDMAVVGRGLMRSSLVWESSLAPRLRSVARGALTGVHAWLLAPPPRHHRRI